MWTLEYLPNGKFRIVAPDGKTFGQRTDYHHVATIVLSGRAYFAVSAYFDGTEGLPIETVLPIVGTTIKTRTVDHTLGPELPD